MFEALLLAGTAMQIYGNIEADKQAARAARMNLDYYNYLTQVNSESFDRASRLQTYQQQKFVGSQVAAFAKAGVQFSGSAIDSLHETLTQQAGENFALRKQFEAEQTYVDYKKRGEAAQLSYLQSPMRLLTSVGVPALGGASSYAAYKARE